MATSSPEEEEEAYEQKNVHEVYQQIAEHFSSTRYKPWPIVERFLKELPAGSIGLDVGCGNGKYLSVNKDVYIIASDRSSNLARIASRHHHQSHSTVVVADILNLPHQNARFDFAISIAVVHHLSTPARRVQAIAEILRTLRPASNKPPQGSAGGRALIYVWALEQKTSRRGWDKGDQQDVMVPWVMKGGGGATSKSSRDEQTPTQTQVETFHRYYHLYEAQELERDIINAGGQVLESGYEKDNWWAIATRPEGRQDV